MKTNSLSLPVSTAVASAFLTFGIGHAHAAMPTPIPVTVDASIQSPQFENVVWEEARAEKLRHAYYLLEHADGDYHGHRLEAMHSVKKAAELVGMELNGHAHAEESQWASDRRLREAKHILESVAVEGHHPEQTHIHRAIKELDKALATK